MPEFIVQTLEKRIGTYRVIAEDADDAHACFLRHPSHGHRGRIDTDAIVSSHSTITAIDVTGVKPA